jgi:type VI secretion system protein ImpA
MTTIEELLAPVSSAQPCGEDLAFSPELDAIAKARQADDPSLEQGAWVTSLKEADWKFVHSQCAQLIEKRSKDLKLAVWMAEAGAKRLSFRGLGDGLALMAALCERYWDGLYPLPDDGAFDQRIGNLCWIAARAPQLIRDMPLTDGDGCSSRAFYETLLADCAWCMASIDALERAIDDRLGADGPGLSAARAALEAVLHAVTPAAREAGVDVGEVEASPAQDALVVATATAKAGPVQDRAQALAKLREVAEFFRSTEPHSPVAYLADKAARWAEQPLHVWLRGVVKDQATFDHLQELLGVEEGGR